VDDTPILNTSWPDDLNPADVPFNGRTETVLRRQGFYDDWLLFEGVTEAVVRSWWNAGPATVDDMRTTGNEAIRHHHETVDVRQRIDTDLAAVAQEPWAGHIWYPDPRFAEFIPKGNATVYDIATSGTAVDRRALWDTLDDLRAAVKAQAALSLPEAVSEYIEVVSGQHGQRLGVLLAVTGLNGLDPIPSSDGGRLLGVSRQRIEQIVQQMHRRVERARPRNGAWLPQFVVAELTQWPEEYTVAGIKTTRAKFWHRVVVPSET
jgi:hypothetical protein